MESDSASGPATKRLPPWMLAPGAPTHPNFAAYGSKLSKLAEEKKKLFDELNLLRGSLKGDENRSQVDEERASLRLRMSEIDAQRKKEKDLRVGKNDEISRVRKQRRETSDRLRSLLSDLGGFTDLKEIDAAIQYVMNKMETGSGGLSAEKRTLKRLHQLEEAKTLLLQLQPLEEAIQEAGEREVMLQQEYREIHERIGILNKEYEDEFQSKQNIDKEARKGGTERVEIAAKCSALYARITKLNEEISSLRAQRTKESADWDTWCTEARAKYDQKMEAEREARHQKFLEKKKASKLQRARQRQNPYEIEIISCDTVIQYLLQKKQMIRKDEEEKTKRLAAANFDARAAAPPGFVVLNEGKWQDSKSKPQKSSKANTKTSSAQKKRDEPTKVLQHPEDKLKLFRMIDVEPPLSLEFINEKVNEIKTKQEEFRSFIVDGEPEMSSDEEEEEEEGEGVNVPVDGEPKENSS